MIRQNLPPYESEMSTQNVYRVIFFILLLVPIRIPPLIVIVLILLLVLILRLRSLKIPKAKKDEKADCTKISNFAAKI